MSELAERIEQSEFTPGDASLYAELLAVLPAENTFHAWVRDGLNGLQNTQWREELGRSGDALRLALSLRSKGADSTLATAFREALLAHAKAVAVGKEDPPLERQEDLSSLLDAVPCAKAWNTTRSRVRATLTIASSA